MASASYPSIRDKVVRDLFGPQATLSTLTPEQRADFTKQFSEWIKSPNGQQIAGYWGGADAALSQLSADVQQAEKDFQVNEVRNAAADTVKNPVVYAADTQLGQDIMAGATNNPATAALMAAQAPGQTETDAAYWASKDAGRAAETMAGPSAYAGDTRAAIDAYGRQIDQYTKDTDLFRAAAEGRGPSAAQALMAASLDANARNMQGIAAGARGGNVAASMRAATGAGREQGLQAIQQMAALRAQEQLGAMGQLGQAQIGLSGAMAGRAGAVTGATNAETGRGQAYVSGMKGAADAATGAANAAVAGGDARLRALAAAGQLYGQGWDTARGVLGTQVTSGGNAASTGVANQNTALQAFTALSGEQQHIIDRNTRVSEADKDREAEFVRTGLGIGANAIGQGLGIATGGKK